MKRNSSHGMQRIAQHVRNTIAAGNAADIIQLKVMFGAEDLVNNIYLARSVPYFASFTPNPDHVHRHCRMVTFTLNPWQTLQFSNTAGRFFAMCGKIVGAASNIPGSNIPEIEVGLEKALPKFTYWLKTNFLPNSKAFNILDFFTRRTAIARRYTLTYLECANRVSVSNNLTLYKPFLAPNPVICFDISTIQIV